MNHAFEDVEAGILLLVGAYLSRKNIDDVGTYISITKLSL